MKSPLQGRRTELMALLRPIVEEMGYSFEGLQVQGGVDAVLRLFIDSSAGITADDCEKVSKAIDPLLDDAIPGEERYYLEVSSPGLERPLIDLEDYQRFQGRYVKVRLKEMLEGVKRFRGLLESASETGEIRLKTDMGSLPLSFDAIEEGSLVYVPQKGQKKTFKTKKKATKGGRS